MTDTTLLRLARLMLRFVGNESSNDPDSLNIHAALFDLVRDIEAAESMRLRLADSTENEAPARRTITREEFERASTEMELRDGTSRSWPRYALFYVVRTWRLTAEDA